MVQFDHSTTPINENPQTGADCNGHQPDWLVPRFDSIPVELKKSRQFLTWKAHKRDSKWSKVPYNARNGNLGSSTDPETWSSFDEAKAAYTRGGYTGFGVAMADVLAGVDLDHCVDPEMGEIAEWALLIIREFDSYTEISPSGKGVRILFKGKLPGKGLNRNVDGCHIEMYDKGRFLTLTGHHISSTPNTIEPRQEAADSRYQWILDNTDGRKKSAKQSTKESSAQPVFDPNQKGKNLTDSEVMDCAMNAQNGAKFEKLLDGDISDYADATHPEGNPSRADSAMVEFLCYHTLDDEQVARLWKASKLYRYKLERQDYIPRTIKFIRDNQTDVCARVLPKKAPSTNNGSYTVKMVGTSFTTCAAEIDDIVLLMLKECEPVWTEEDKLTFLALIAVFGGRRTAAVSRNLLARRIRKLDNSGKVATVKNLDQFGGRRLTSLRKALCRSFNVPILTLIEHSKRRGLNKRTGKPKPSRYSLDLTIFRQALFLAHGYYQEWCDGKPRFKEWQGDEDYKPKPNKGACREAAARVIARRYIKLTEPEEQAKTDKSEPDDFTKQIGYERTMWRAAGNWANVTDGLTTQDRRVQAGRVLDHMRLILLHDDKRERRRMLLKLLRDSRSGSREHTFIDEGMKIVVEDSAEQPADNGACRHYSVNTNGDMKDVEIRPGPAIWRNADFDQYVEVTGSAGIGSDGREYVSIRGSATGISADEIYYPEGDMWLEELEEPGSGPELSPEELAEMMDEVTASAEY